MYPSNLPNITFFKINNRYEKILYDKLEKKRDGLLLPKCETWWEIKNYLLCQTIRIAQNDKLQANPLSPVSTEPSAESSCMKNSRLNGNIGTIDVTIDLRLFDERDLFRRLNNSSSIKVVILQRWEQIKA